MQKTSSQRVQVGHQVVQLLLRDGFSHRRHHIAPTDDRLLDEPIGCGQPARQEFLVKNIFEARSFGSRR